MPISWYNMVNEMECANQLIDMMCAGLCNLVREYIVLRYSDSQLLLDGQAPRVVTRPLKHFSKQLQ